MFIIDMKFCVNCDNYLSLKIIDSKDSKQSDSKSDSSSESDSSAESKKCTLKYICRKCNEEYPSTETDSCVFNIDFNLDNIKKNSFINEFIYDDITNPKAEGIKCPNINCPDAKPDIVYIQYDKDNMKYIYVCKSCYRAGIEPHIW